MPLFDVNVNSIIVIWIYDILRLDYRPIGIESRIKAGKVVIMSEI